MTIETMVAIASLSLTAAGTTVGWILTAMRASTSLQVRLQRLQDGLEAIERSVDAQTERIDKLAHQVETQNGRVRQLEVDLARHCGHMHGGNAP